MSRPGGKGKGEISDQVVEGEKVKDNFDEIIWGLILVLMIIGIYLIGMRVIENV